MPVSSEDRAEQQRQVNRSQRPLSAEERAERWSEANKRQEKEPN